MLKKFQVENYKGFKELLSWDLSETRDYGYNKDLVENKIVKKALIFGKNGTGKSNLCTAVMDITAHLSDAKKDVIPPHIYTYVGSDKPYAKFTYIFQFEQDTVSYTYCKATFTELLLETLSINGKQVLLHNFIDEKDNFIKIKGAEKLKTNGLQKQLSVIKFIYNNTIRDEDSAICKIMHFVEGMLFFRSMKEANQYIGYKSCGELLQDSILNNGKLEEFSELLKQFGLNYTLVPMRTMSGFITIGAKFENGNIVEFENICSSGTKTLMLFYYWMLHFSNLTLLIVDEFDAYYHYETSEKVLRIIHSFKNIQSIVSTQSVTLMNTDLVRPDCCFILDNNKIKNICNCINKELRVVHNLEKMYRGGNFIVK